MKNKWVIPIVIFILATGFFYLRGNDNGNSSSEDVQVSNESPQDAVSTQENNKVLERMQGSIVWVKYDLTEKDVDGHYVEQMASGSGVIVGNDGGKLTIFTNRHVVDCEYSDIKCFQRVSENVQIRTQDGKIHTVDRISFSKSDVDLAILSVKVSNSEMYPSAQYTARFKEGDSVTAVGYPAYGADNVVEFSISNGKITKIKEVLSQSTGFGFRVIESDAYTYFGSSGGGLFDKDGALIGINTWITNKESVAIDFSSIAEEDFIYCSAGAYFAEGKCYQLCSRDQVMDYKNRSCYDVCEDFYCHSNQPSASDERCKDAGYIAGADGYCHLPCGSSSLYCQEIGSICLNNQCYPPCESGQLWEDGNCRYNE